MAGKQGRLSGHFGSHNNNMCMGWESLTITAEIKWQKNINIEISRNNNMDNGVDFECGTAGL